MEILNRGKISFRAWWEFQRLYWITSRHGLWRQALQVPEEELSISSRSISKRRLGLAWAFETTKVTPQWHATSNKALYIPTRPHLLVLLPLWKCPTLVTKHSTLWAYGDIPTQAPHWPNCENSCLLVLNSPTLGHLSNLPRTKDLSSHWCLPRPSSATYSARPMCTP